MRLLVRADGTTIALERAYSFHEIAAMIGADVLDSRNLNPHEPENMVVMIFDDLFLSKRLPVNHRATHLYHAAGFSQQQTICGDVVIVPDADFANPPKRSP
jgi:hypothetical protein